MFVVCVDACVYAQDSAVGLSALRNKLVPPL